MKLIDIKEKSRITGIVKLNKIKYGTINSI